LILVLQTGYGFTSGRLAIPAKFAPSVAKKLHIRLKAVTYGIEEALFPGIRGITCGRASSTEINHHDTAILKPI
jgi:hypothetical protein